MKLKYITAILVSVFCLGFSQAQISDINSKTPQEIYNEVIAAARTNPDGFASFGESVIGQLNSDNVTSLVRAAAVLIAFSDLIADSTSTTVKDQLISLGTRLDSILRARSDVNSYAEAVTEARTQISSARGEQAVEPTVTVTPTPV